MTHGQKDIKLPHYTSQFIQLALVKGGGVFRCNRSLSLFLSIYRCHRPCLSVAVTVPVCLSLSPSLSVYRCHRPCLSVAAVSTVDKSYERY
jgi:hypothetical protein